MQGGYTDTGINQTAEAGVEVEGPTQYHKSGDDAVLVWMRLLMMIANIVSVYASGQLLKENSQSFSHRSTEYLRIVYSNIGAHSYLARLLGTIILRVVNRDFGVPLDGKLSGMSSYVSELVRKGYALVPARVLLRALVAYVRNPLDRKDNKLRLDLYHQQ